MGKERTNQLTAFDDDGRQYRVVEYQNVHPAPTAEDPKAVTRGLFEYELFDGAALNRNAENPNEFAVVNDGMIIRIK